LKFAGGLPFLSGLWSLNLLLEFGRVVGVSLCSPVGSVSRILPRVANTRSVFSGTTAFLSSQTRFFFSKYGKTRYIEISCFSRISFGLLPFNKSSKLIFFIFQMKIFPLRENNFQKLFCDYVAKSLRLTQPPRGGKSHTH